MTDDVCDRPLTDSGMVPVVIEVERKNMDKLELVSLLQGLTPAEYLSLTVNSALRKWG